MNSSYLTSFSPVRLKERQLLLLLLCAFEFPCCHKPGKHRGEESTWSSNISDGFDGVTLVLGESQKTTVKKKYGNILVLSFIVCCFCKIYCITHFTRMQL